MSENQKIKDEEKTKLAVYLPSGFSIQIKQMGIDSLRKKERKMTSTTIIAEALNDYFKKHGYPEIEY